MPTELGLALCTATFPDAWKKGKKKEEETECWSGRSTPAAPKPSVLNESPKFAVSGEEKVKPYCSTEPRGGSWSERVSNELAREWKARSTLLKAPKPRGSTHALLSGVHRASQPRLPRPVLTR